MEKSVAQDALREASIAHEETEAQMRIVGEKVFVLRDGIWIDTQYTGREELTQIPFGSAAYFRLLSEHPAWTKYLAVGEQVIFVAEGETYQISPLASAETMPAPEQPAGPIAKDGWLSRFGDWLTHLVD